MTFPIESIRSKFPALSLTDDGRARVYLDNPAGTQVPQSVADAVSHCLLNSNANLGGHFATSRAAVEVVENAHKAMADFLGTDDPGEIIIGANMTTLTLHLSRCLARDWQEGDEIIVTRMDHEGDVAPWLEVARDKGMVVKWADFSADSWQIDPGTLAGLVSERTRLVALGYASNLTGSINDVKALAGEVKAANPDALVYVDAVQFAPHGLVDVKALGCDFLACSSYKFFGPHLGIAWGRREILKGLDAYKCRCVGEELPGKFETGTPQIELLAGLTATVDYYAALGAEIGAAGGRRAQLAAAFEAAIAHEEELAGRLIAGLRALPGVSIIGIAEQNRLKWRVPTVSFRHETIKPEVFARRLGENGIFLWNGHNYALGVVQSLGIPEDEGVVRVGIAHYNSTVEVDRTLEVIGGVIEG